MASSALPPELVRQIQALSRVQKLRLVQHVAHDLASTETVETDSCSTAVGALADQADLLDQVVSEALDARERDPIRQTGA